jgi:glutamate synthase (NADPH/NADH)
MTSKVKSTRRWSSCLESRIQQEIAFVRGLIEDHHHYTGSELAARILLDFNRALPRFVKVMPTDYKRVLLEEAAKAEPKPRRRNILSQSSLAIPYDEAHEESKKAQHGHETKEKKKNDLLDIEESVGDAKAEKKKVSIGVG